MAPKFTFSNSPAFFAVLTLAIASMGFGLLGCQASENTQRGAEGEFCNGEDDDCREDLACRDYICSPVSQQPSVNEETCDQICDRLDDCVASIDNCSSLCVNTIDGWGTGAIDSFRQCFIDDMSCQQLQDSDDPPQTCYDAIPLDEERVQRCENFAQGALSCGAEDEQLSEFDKECRRTARTSGADRWADNLDCVEHIDGECGELLPCLNDSFDFSPEFE